MEMEKWHWKVVIFAIKYSLYSPILITTVKPMNFAENKEKQALMNIPKMYTELLMQPTEKKINYFLFSPCYIRLDKIEEMGKTNH
jgi:hypothetical protein